MAENEYVDYDDFISNYLKKEIIGFKEPKVMIDKNDLGDYDLERYYEDE